MLDIPNCVLGGTLRPHVIDKMDLDRNTPENGEAEETGGEDKEAGIMALMGFGGFDSTKGKQVEGNQSGVAKVNKPRTWRQYMNR